MQTYDPTGRDDRDDRPAFAWVRPAGRATGAVLLVALILAGAIWLL